jgi:hypothetical protein
MNRKTKYARKDAVYFHCLHTNVAPRQKGELNADGTTIVEIEGKSRRMLVLSCHYRVDMSTVRPTGKKQEDDCEIYEAVARIGYLVLPLQGQIPEHLKDEFMELPRGCLDDDLPTVVHLRPQSYPPESISQFPHKPVKALDSWIVDSICHQINRARHLRWHKWHMA